MYHSAATARDRDRLRQQVLENLGWKIHRIWSTEWVMNKEKELKRLKQAIEESRAQPTAINEEEHQEEELLVELIKSSPEEALTLEQLTDTTYYEPSDIEAPGNSDLLFHLPQYRERQCSILRNIVDAEGPIHRELASKRLLKAWGISRMGNKVEDAINESIRMCERRGYLNCIGDFLWPSKVNEVGVRIPDKDNPETVTNIEHIPPEEIQAAMMLITKHALGISQESLINETARLFGFDRTGEHIVLALLREYRKLVKIGHIKRNGNSLVYNGDSEE
jgi:hypothetical protein